MRQAERKKEKDKIAIVLVLCFCVIALTSIFTIKSSIDKINGSISDVPVSDQAPSSESEDKTEAEDSQADNPAEVSAQVPTVDSLEKGTGNAGNGELRFGSPVNAQDSFVTNEYSMDALIYSVTLDQYMVHCGVDLEAPADTQVLALADGTVTAVYNDDRYGHSVEITHDEHFVSIYSNLSDASMVEVGDDVTAGQIIGGVGTTGLFESLEPAHLHLELLKDGVYVDPMDYIGM